MENRQDLMKNSDHISIFSSQNNRDQTLSLNSQPIQEIQNSSFDDGQLVQLHKVHGNKWKKISTYFHNRNDSFIKNHFYSLLRRSLRRINSYTKKINKTNNIKNKILKLNFVFKLTNLAESERDGFSINKYYTNLLYQFLQLRNQIIIQPCTNSNILQTGQQYIGYEKIQNLLNSLKSIEQLFLQHNLNKKGKSKKKCPKKLQLKKNLLIHYTNKNQSDDFLKNQTIEINDQYQEKLMISPTSTRANFSMDAEESRLKSFDIDQDLQQYIGISGFVFENNYDPILFE